MRMLTEISACVIVLGKIVQAIVQSDKIPLTLKEHNATTTDLGL